MSIGFISISSRSHSDIYVLLIYQNITITTYFSQQNLYVITGLGVVKDGDLLITKMHNAVNAATRKTFPRRFPFLFGST